MNWDSNAPLELLKEMPAKLTKDNLKKIQLVIDKDKFACSGALNQDLCGEYAPFCIFCDKTEMYPCALSYVRMKQIEGMQLEIAVTDDGQADTVHEEEVPIAAAQLEILEPEVLEPAAVEPENTAEEVNEPAAAEEKTEEKAEEEIQPAEEIIEPAETKKRIRIAIARRKN